MIAGTEAATAYFSREAVERAAGPKELFRVEGASHFDLYDKDEFVTVAVANQTSFYTSHLGRSQAIHASNGARWYRQSTKTAEPRCPVIVPCPRTRGSLTRTSLGLPGRPALRPSRAAPTPHPGPAPGKPHASLAAPQHRRLNRRCHSGNHDRQQNRWAASGLIHKLGPAPTPQHHGHQPHLRDLRKR